MSDLLDKASLILLRGNVSNFFAGLLGYSERPSKLSY